MITDKVITSIYKQFRRPAKHRDDLRLDYFIEMLEPHHKIKVDGEELVIEDLEEFNPFRCFLIRSLHAILEFDRMVAFVFGNHILFLSKESNRMRVHIKPEKPRSLISKLFGRK